MIFDFLTPPQDPRAGPKMLLDAPYMSLTRQIWLEFIQWFRRRYHNGLTDRWTDGACVSILELYLRALVSGLSPIQTQSHTLLVLLSFIATAYICTFIERREQSGSVVECLTRDRVVAGSSLTGVTAL